MLRSHCSSPLPSPRALATAAPPWTFLLTHACDSSATTKAHWVTRFHEQRRTLMPPSSGSISTPASTTTTKLRICRGRTVGTGNTQAGEELKLC
uniref:Uncharacterized protein n=1 Tax=Arundo donax TaxID=35708 RepID=A0A0A9BD63_ARUDO